jgi:hypothetical protein
MQPRRQNLFPPNHFAAAMLLVVGTAAVLSGCAAIPLNRLQPVVAPPSPTCTSSGGLGFLTSENEPAKFHYALPNGATDTIVDFETYRTRVHTAVQAKLPSALKQHKVTTALTDFLLSVSAEAQLDAQIADGTVKASKATESQRSAIQKHSGPSKLTHGEMKDFADKLFDLQLKPGAAALTSSSVDQSGLSAKETKFATTNQPDPTFIAYFQAYYKGQFIDRMGTKMAAPQISLTVPDTEITAAETVLLEFLMDTIDPTPVMGGDDPGSVTSSTIFYPGATANTPTVYAVTHAANPAIYVKIPAGSATACGITTTNVWVLRDLANGASDQAAAVGGLIANTPGGLSLGLGVVGKLSIGDNQTLSVLVKTAASRVALRATLASSYFTLRHVKFNVTEPGS